MKIKDYYVFLLTLSSLWLCGFADMSEGNRLFLSSDYKGAIQKYREIADRGVEDANLFFNLGTSYLYSGEYGNAIYWYYRTMLLNGISEDIKRNIRLAVEGLEEEGIVYSGADSILFDYIVKYYHPALSVVFIILINLLFFILILKRFLLIKRGMKALISVLSLLVIILTLFVGLRFTFVHLQTRGIIIVKTADIKEGPSEVYKTLSQINEGMMVRVKERYQDFLLIEVPDSKRKGWVLSEQVGILRTDKL
ncbi:MAG: hypothetical protein ACP5QK_09580 [Myxococcota bacterium]